MAVDDLYIPDGVFLKCDEGAKITTLKVNHKKHKLYGEIIATEIDNIPITNIPSFGACSATGSACLPKSPEWKRVHEGATKIEGKKPLLQTSFCKCQQGGTIDIFFNHDEAIDSLESDKKYRVDKDPIDNILAYSIPMFILLDLMGRNTSNISRGIRKGLKGTYVFISEDLNLDTLKGVGKIMVAETVGYLPPVSTSSFGGISTLPPSQSEIDMIQNWLKKTPEERINEFDKIMGTDLTPVHKGLMQSISDFNDKKIIYGTRAEHEVLMGEIYEFIFELFFGNKILSASAKLIKNSVALAKASEKTAKAIVTINEFVKASKSIKLAKSIEGVFKVGGWIYKGLAKKEAYKYAQELLNSLSNNKMPRAVCVIVDKDTGKIYRGISKGVGNLDNLDKNVINRLPKPSNEKWPAENCAEVDAYNKAIKDGVNPNNMEMHTVSIDTKERKYIDFKRCKNCIITTKDVGSVTSD